MSWRKGVIRGVLGGLAWAWLGLSGAQAGVVPPTDPATLKLSSDISITVSLYQLDSSLPATVSLQSPSRCTTTGTPFYRDVTDCWLPEWSPASSGKAVYVVVNGSTVVPTLVPPALGVSLPLASGTANPFVTALTTSAYPGQCTNIGAGAEADFTLGPPTTLQTSSNTSVVGYALTPTDCGGMAVVQVGSSLKFILPKDGTTSVPANGIPEVWENLYGGNLKPGAPCGDNNLHLDGDIDSGPAPGAPCGDGISTFDEYRGFIVSGKQIRTDPTQKDVFLHLVNPADSVGGVFAVSASCGTSCLGGGTTTYPIPTSPNATLTLGAGGTFTTTANVFSTANVGGEITGSPSGRARIVAVTGPTSATAEITQPFPAGTTSLAPGSWKVSESLFANVYAAIAPERVHLLGYVPGGTNLLTNEWVDSFVSLVPAQTLTESVTAPPDRTVNPNRVYGAAQKGLRIMEGLNINASAVLGYSFGVASPNQAGDVIVFTQRIINYILSLIPAGTTLQYSTASLVNGTWTWASPMVTDQNFILSKAFQFYTGMEILHSLDLTPAIQGTTKTSYGHHFAPGTGDCLDQAITTTSKGSTVTFYIPSLCGGADQTQFLLK